MDEVDDSVIKEVAPQDGENHETQQQKLQESTVDDRQDKNWKRMRQRQEDLERELRLQREMNEKLMQMTAQAQTKQQEVDEFEGISDEEFIPKGKVKKLVQQERQRIVQDTVQEMEKRLAQEKNSQFMDRLKRQYPDFDEIVNPETLSILEETDLELAQTIAEIKDPYKIGVQSYKYIKAMGIAEKAPTARRAKEVDKKLEKNSKTVQSPQAYEKRPMAQAFRMTEADNKALYKEMMGYASQAGFSY